MALSDYKITEAQINQNGVISAPDILTGTADENKKVFDKLIRQIVATAVNNLIDALSGSDAASEIPISNIDGLDAQTVQQAITEIYQGLNDYISLIAGNEGASQVGVNTIDGVSGSNVQQALQSIKGLIDTIQAGTLPDGAVTSDLIADSAVTAQKIADDAIVQLGALLAVAAAAAYNPSGTYAIGDYCTNDGNLYKCNTPIESGEAWNAAHWTETTVAAELAEVRASLSNKVGNLALETPNNNCNDIVDFGLYKVRGDTANAYTSVAGNLVLNAPWDINTIFQLFCDWGNLEIAYRTKTYGIENPWCDWVKIATATLPQVRNLTLQSGFSANDDCTFFVTQESAVFLAGGVSGTLPANQGTQIGTLPADVRPAAKRRRPAVTNAGAAYIDIHTDGTVWVHSFAAASQCWFDTSFVAGGGS